MVTRRVLFVDDEPALLGALKTMFRKQRSEWDMVFVTSGEAALAELSRGPFDVVVSDMRMPGIDGAELLARIASLWPRTACFILSGYAEEESRRRAKAIARAYFAKPCEAALLKAAIEGAS